MKSLKFKPRQRWIWILLLLAYCEEKFTIFNVVCLKKKKNYRFNSSKKKKKKRKNLNSNWKERRVKVVGPYPSGSVFNAVSRVFSLTQRFLHSMQQPLTRFINSIINLFFGQVNFLLIILKVLWALFLH